MNIVNQVYGMRKRLKDDDLRKLKTIIEDEMIRRDSNRETQKPRNNK